MASPKLYGTTSIILQKNLSHKLPANLSADACLNSLPFSVNRSLIERSSPKTHETHLFLGTEDLFLEQYRLIKSCDSGPHCSYPVCNCFYLITLWHKASTTSENVMRNVMSLAVVL